MLCIIFAFRRIAPPRDFNLHVVDIVYYSHFLSSVELRTLPSVSFNAIEMHSRELSSQLFTIILHNTRIAIYRKSRIL